MATTKTGHELEVNLATVFDISIGESQGATQSRGVLPNAQFSAGQLGVKRELRISCVCFVEVPPGPYILGRGVEVRVVREPVVLK